MLQAVLFSALFVLIVAAVIFARHRLGDSFQIKATDLVLAVSPAIIWLFTSGQLSEFAYGDLSLKLREIYNKPVVSKVLSENSTDQDIELIHVGVDCVFSHEKDITSASTFPAYRRFEYLVILDNCVDDERGESNPVFFGAMEIQAYKDLFLGEHTKSNPNLFIEMVKTKNLNGLEKLPTFVSADNALGLESSKLDSLKGMAKLDRDYLPLVDSKDKYMGIVRRSQLTTDFLIDIGELSK